MIQVVVIRIFIQCLPYLTASGLDCGLGLVLDVALFFVRCLVSGCHLEQLRHFLNGVIQVLVRERNRHVLRLFLRGVQVLSVLWVSWVFEISEV